MKYSILGAMLNESIGINEANQIDKKGWYVVDYSNNTGKCYQIIHHEGISPFTDAYKSVLFYSSNLNACINYLSKIIVREQKNIEFGDGMVSYMDRDWKYK